jgi:hypothetical protein
MFGTSFEALSGVGSSLCQPKRPSPCGSIETFLSGSRRKVLVIKRASTQYFAPFEMRRSNLHCQHDTQALQPASQIGHSRRFHRSLEAARRRDRSIRRRNAAAAWMPAMSPFTRNAGSLGSKPERRMQAFDFAAACGHNL